MRPRTLSESRSVPSLYPGESFYHWRLLALLLVVVCVIFIGVTHYVGIHEINHKGRPVRWQALVFLGILACQAAINVTFSIPVVCLFFLRRMESWKFRCEKKGEQDNDHPEPETTGLNAFGPQITAIVPCYLPNEVGIIESTIFHILEHVEAPGELLVWVVYNTPKDMPEIEERLQQIASDTALPRGRRLIVSRVQESTSKAENLNYVLGLVSTKYVVIYDADHHPKSDSLLKLYDMLQRKKLDCAQGSTYIRDIDSSGVLGRLVDAEFFFSYFIAQPSARFFTRLAYFGGSNALWEAEVLQGLGFRKSMQTEDIDVSFRAIVDKRRIDLCPEAQSGELAPVSLYAFFRQRMRWTVGWDQVSMDLFKYIGYETVSFKTYLGIVHLLYVRWFNNLAGVTAGVVIPLLHFAGYINPAQHGVWGTATWSLQMSVWALLLSSGICIVVEAAIQAHCQRWRWGQLPVLVAFLLASSIYVTYQLLMVCISLCRIAFGCTSGWYVSPRKRDGGVGVGPGIVRVSEADKDGRGMPGMDQIIDPNVIA
mmetsp:Transcript_30953/g.68293  ORF Transcript_30953/g.68293 Transcript_30953/m.68293 type:complete len:539 (-) Transcript_30953:41-1657(-)